MKKIYLQINIVANNEVRNIAFAKGINRSINLGNVEKILAMMKVKGYRKAEQIQVIKAEDVIKTGDISLVDINGQDIKPEDAAKYFLVLDGQHRAAVPSRKRDVGIASLERRQSGEVAIMQCRRVDGDFGHRHRPHRALRQRVPCMIEIRADASGMQAECSRTFRQ